MGVSCDWRVPFNTNFRIGMKEGPKVEDLVNKIIEIHDASGIFEAGITADLALGDDDVHNSHVASV